MNSKDIDYVITIAEEKSISRAAQKLYVTSSALSQMLVKIEQDVGAKLFNRNKSGLEITPAGQIFIDNGREILEIEKKTYSMISDITNQQSRTISLGFTPGRGPAMLVDVYPEFHKKYPSCILDPRELRVSIQQEQIHDGSLDLGFMTLTDDQKTNDEYIDLFPEELMLALPHGYPLQLISSPIGDDPYPTADLYLLREEPFILMYKPSTIRTIIDPLFNEAGFVPNVLFETSSNQTIIEMIRGRMCCGIIPYHYVKRNPAGIDYYHLPSRPTWKVCASYRRNSYLSKPEKALIKLVQDYWEH